MKKILSILAAVLFCTTYFYPQAAVDIPLIVSDGNNNSIPLYVGLDLTATNGIDTALGEHDISMIPPAGVFDTRFDLTPYAGSDLSTLRDYRNAPAFPFSGIKEHKLQWAISTGANTLSIVYNLPGSVTLQLIDPIGGGFFNSGVLSGAGTYTFTPPGFLAYGTLTVTYVNTAPIPVELTSFTAMQNGSSIKLDWTTASETNNKGFELERKKQNSVWEVISFIEGHGTTTETQTYSYIDELNNSISGSLSYRLKQIDYDGTVEYSDELNININPSPDNCTLYQNYPNPFNPSTIISYSIPEFSKVNIKVFDILGNEISTLVDEEKPAGKYDIRWNADDIPSGVYFYKLTAGAFVEMKKMILTK